jgi:hypothetical protein
MYTFNYTMGKINFTEGITFFVFEALFCVSFIALCEVPNWTMGPKQANFCTDRWMFTAGVFFPSAVSTAKTFTTSTRTSRNKQE